MHQPPVYEPHPDDKVDEITSTAASMMLLDKDIPMEDPSKLEPMEKALRYHAMRIDRNDFGSLEMMLTYQTQMLHRLFTHSVGKYAGGNNEGELRRHSDVALQSQRHCRMTIASIAKLKKSRNEIASTMGNPFEPRREK